MAGLGLIGLVINSHLFIAKIINEMYFLRMCPSDRCKAHKGDSLEKKTVQLTNNLFKIQFSIIDVLSRIKLICCTKVLKRDKNDCM